MVRSMRYYIGVVDRPSQGILVGRGRNIAPRLCEFPIYRTSLKPQADVRNFSLGPKERPGTASASRL